jgi:soluble lytic murein transglycosylase-like protein
MSLLILFLISYYLFLEKNMSPEAYCPKINLKRPRRLRLRHGLIGAAALTAAAAAAAHAGGKEKSEPAAPPVVMTTPVADPDILSGSVETQYIASLPPSTAAAVEQKNESAAAYPRFIDREIENYLSRFKGAARANHRQKILKEIEEARAIVRDRCFRNNEFDQAKYFAGATKNEKHRRALAHLLEKYSQKYHLPREFLAGVMAVESRGIQGARSAKGAVGVMQVLPIAAVGSGVVRGEELFDEDKDGNLTVNPRKEEKLRRRLAEDMGLNIEVGAAYLSKLLARYDGDYVLALAAYSGGPGKLETRIIEKYNDEILRGYERELRQSAGKGYPPAKPELLTRKKIAQTMGWARFLELSGISFADFLDDSESFYPTDTYPFKAEMLGRMFLAAIDKK